MTAIDAEALARLRELPERLRHAATTNVNDDYSEPMTEKRTRMIARLDVMLEAANALPALLDIAEAVARVPVIELLDLVYDTSDPSCGNLHAEMVGKEVRIVPCTGGASNG